MQLIILASLIHVALAHNWLLYPVPRTPGSLYGGSSKPDQANSCENLDTSIPNGNTFVRGQRIDAKHIYNNHYGGFVRFSIVPMGQETSLDAVNDPKNFLRIACHTTNCGGRVHSVDGPAYDYYKPYNLPKQQGIPLDFSSTTDACHTGVTFPTHLKDGQYVLSWIVYGMRGNLGDHPEAMGLPFYRNCANVKISGGAKLTTKPSGKAAQCAFEWSGGDRTLSKISNVNDIDASHLDTSKCSYWRFNSINKTLDASYYNPTQLWNGAGELGLPATDMSALRAGPPAEVLACGKNMQSFISRNSTTASTASAVIVSATPSEQAKDARVLQATAADASVPLTTSNGTASCVKLRRHKRERRRLFDQNSHT